eukprot:3888868-Prymnesium_polylepis.1
MAGVTVVELSSLHPDLLASRRWFSPSAAVGPRPRTVRMLVDHVTLADEFHRARGPAHGGGDRR